MTVPLTGDEQLPHMPTDGYAPPAEVLDFCNRVRAAGGAKALDALMPGVPSDSSSCLIARNLNFQCEVQPCHSHISKKNQPVAAAYSDNEAMWFMRVEDEKTRHRIARELDLPLMQFQGTPCLKPSDEAGGAAVWKFVGPPYEAILLPREIGRTAAAFDADQYDELQALVEYEDESYD
jgi:hypothetical protein